MNPLPLNIIATNMARLSTNCPTQSITFCILATSILTTNIFTSCDARLFKVFRSLSWEPTEDLDYYNPADIDTYRAFEPLGPIQPPSTAPQPALFPIGPPTTPVSMISDPPRSAAKPPGHSPLGGRPPSFAVWCVARPTMPEPTLQKAMDYACGFGADCKDILPNGACFVPNSLVAHASYAFNSYWQRTKKAGGSCDFGGTAMLITVDPSFEKCHFVYV